MAWNIFLIEKETSQKIDWDYPLLKFYSLLENYKEYCEKVNKK